MIHGISFREEYEVTVSANDSPAGFPPVQSSAMYLALTVQTAIASLGDKRFLKSSDKS